MEQEGADILVGPLSGDEGIAVANYAKEHPDKTFINGIAGAQDSTLKVQAPNFFRFHPDGAQWSAGLGDYAYNKLGWKKAAIIGDDYSFPYTSLAGFVAEYCSIGGDITKRVWAAAGREGLLVLHLADPEGRRRHLRRHRRLGPDLVHQAVQAAERQGRHREDDGQRLLGRPARPEGGRQGPGGRRHLRDDRGGRQLARGQGVHRQPEDQLRRRDRRRRPVGVHLRLLHGRACAGEGPRGRQRRHHRPEASCRTRSRRPRCRAKRPRGATSSSTTTARRSRTSSSRRSSRTRRATACRTSRRSRRSRGSTRRSAAPSPPTRLRRTARTRSARRAPPRRGSGNAEKVNVRRLARMAAPATSAEGAAPILRLRGVGRRFGGVVAVSGVDLEVRPGERRAILGPNGAGKTTLFNLISGEFPPTAGSVELFGRDVTALPARKRARMGLSRTFQTSRLFGGLTVDDNLYLAVLGVHDGHFRLINRGEDAEMRERGRAMAEAVGLDRQARRARRRALARRAAPARGRHGPRRRPAADDARRAGRGPLARRAREAHRAAALARSGDHADPDRARHGRRLARRRVGDDDARRQA